jgi:hypothetical protein
MCGFFDKSGLLRYRRATTPKYRDIRDRSTWELQDELWYEGKEPFSPGQVVEYFQSESTDAGNFDVALLRMGTRDPTTGVIEYIVPGRPLIKASFVIYTLKRKNVVGKVVVREDLRLVLGDQQQILVANALYYQDEAGDAGLTTVSQTVFSVTKATGTWTGATNVIFDYFNDIGDGNLRRVRIFRALN